MKDGLLYRIALFQWKLAGGKERFFEDLAQALEIPTLNPSRVIARMAEDARRQGRVGAGTDPEAMVLGKVARRLSAGRPLSEALGDILTPVERMLVRGGEQGAKIARGAGEESRTGLARVFATIVRRARAEHRVRSAAWGAATQVAVYLVASVGAVIVFSAYVIPKIALVYPTSDWHGIPRSMVTVGNVVETPTFFAVFGLLLLLGAALPWILPRWTGRVRAWLDAFPPFSYYRMREGGAWLAAIPALTETGRIKPSDAVRETRAYATPWLRERIRAIERGLERGEGFGQALRRAGGGFPDPSIVKKIALYEAMGLDIERTLRKISDEWLTGGHEILERRLNGFARLAMALFGLVVIWYALGTSLIQTQLTAFLLAGGPHP